MANKKNVELNLPAKKFRAGAVTATIWNNTREVKGSEVEFSSVQIDRSYKDKSGDWKRTNSFGPSDLPRLILVAQEAYKFLVSKED